MHFTSPKMLLAVAFTAVVTAQKCGAPAGGAMCPDELCCSEWNWCGTDPINCGPKCFSKFSGPGSPCVGNGPNWTSKFKLPATPTPKPYQSAIPAIDICGSGTTGPKCPGAGPGGFFYRCCSRNGHCGPKNNIQNQADYCGEGCQSGYGVDCNPFRAVPKNPSGPKGVVGVGGNCGPIVNKRCGKGLCCSGSNFCGYGEEFCGAGNWCQKDWGGCY